MLNLDEILKQTKKDVSRIFVRCPRSSLSNDFYLSPDERKVIFDTIRKLGKYHTALYRLMKARGTEDYLKISDVLEDVRSAISCLVASAERYLDEAKV